MKYRDWHISKLGDCEYIGTLGEEYVTGFTKGEVMDQIDELEDGKFIEADQRIWERMGESSSNSDGA